MTRYVLGCDPGGVTGLCLLDVDRRHFELVQTTPGLVLPLVSALLPGAHSLNGTDVVLAIEKFVVGPRAARSSTPAAGSTTRALIGALIELAAALGVRVVLRSASEVKPWASVARLNAAQVPRPPGMGHAVDGAKHALFEAHHNGSLPDPLSKTWRSPRLPTAPRGDV